MESSTSVNEWLPWLGRVRFLIITALIGVIVAVRQWTPIPLPVRILILLAASWYVLAALGVMLHRWVPGARWHAALQITLDLVIVTGIVYSSGAQESYFVSLYLLAILMGSILFSRRGTFLVAGLSFVLVGSIVELMFYGVIPRTATSAPAAQTLESWLGVNLFAFFAVAYLGSLLTQTIRKKGAELEQKNEALRDLQAFNRDIIESMRGGLLTTDLQGRILLLNRSGAEIMGRGFGLLRGESGCKRLADCA
jgi:two-component system sensor histidine kinase PilS (NtrC family)